MFNKIMWVRKTSSSITTAKVSGWWDLPWEGQEIICKIHPILWPHPVQDGVIGGGIEPFWTLILPSPCNQACWNLVTKSLWKEMRRSDHYSKALLEHISPWVDGVREDQSTKKRKSHIICSWFVRASQGGLSKTPLTQQWAGYLEGEEPIFQVQSQGLASDMGRKAGSGTMPLSRIGLRAGSMLLVTCTRCCRIINLSLEFRTFFVG